MRARLSRRAAACAALFAIALGAGALGYALAVAALYNAAHWSGWTLAALSALAALYGARRAGVGASASTLFMLHILIGALAAIVFWVHAGGAPRGAFALLLWGAYFILLLSGAVGLACEKALARARRSQAPYAHIEIERAEIERRAHAAYQRLMTDNTPPLPFSNYFTRWLIPYFAAHRNWWEHWRNARGARDNMLHAMAYWGSELGEDANYRALLALIEEKYALDRRHALHWLQRGWLFVHLPAMHAAGALIVAHIFAVHAFGG